MTDRPAREEDEIEVTPEMIEAGEEAFCSFDGRVETVRDVVPRIFVEMMRLYSVKREAV